MEIWSIFGLLRRKFHKANYKVVQKLRGEVINSSGLRIADPVIDQQVEPRRLHISLIENDHTKMKPRNHGLDPEIRSELIGSCGHDSSSDVQVNGVGHKTQNL